MPAKKTKNAVKKVEEFPFNSPFDELIKGTTLSKRGVWWTAVLLVKSKKPAENLTDEDNSNHLLIEKQKVIIQRWKKIKRKGDDTKEDIEVWIRKKDFAIGKKAQWEQLKAIIDGWVQEKHWTD
jgi:hypothetical protein